MQKSPPRRPVQQAPTPTRRLVLPLISEIAGGLIFCVRSQDRQPLSVSHLSSELRQLLSLLEAGRFRELDEFSSVPEDILHLKGVCLIGDPDFTHVPNFEAIVQELVRVRAMSRFPEFKIVLITNGEGLDTPPIQLGLRQFLISDEIWIRFNCGLLNNEDELIEKILQLATKRPVVLQSAFFALHGEAPANSEIKNYIRQLKKLRKAGARISLIQICSPQSNDPRREQLKLRNLALIARRVREESGFAAEFY